MKVVWIKSKFDPDMMKQYLEYAMVRQNQGIHLLLHKVYHLSSAALGGSLVFWADSYF